LAAVVRLDESLYSIKNIGENGLPLGEFNQLVGLPVSENSCLPPVIYQDKACADTIRKHPLQTPRSEDGHDEFIFKNETIYIDLGISGEMRKKVWYLSLLALVIVDILLESAKQESRTFSCFS
jgi:hypothetical protein